MKDAAAASAGGNGGADGDVGSARAAAGGHGSSGDEEELDDLWPQPRPSSAAKMLAHIWAENPGSSERWSFGLGGIE